jgi:class 3 adenylate cyclase
MVNKAARISSKGKGGQILLSDQSFEEVQQSPSILEKSSISNLGKHQLKDIQALQTVRRQLEYVLISIDHTDASQ